jgi:hypothetical protein
MEEITVTTVHFEVSSAGKESDKTTALVAAIEALLANPPEGALVNKSNISRSTKRRKRAAAVEGLTRTEVQAAQPQQHS